MLGITLDLQTGLRLQLFALLLPRLDYLTCTIVPLSWVVGGFFSGSLNGVIDVALRG